PARHVSDVATAAEQRLDVALLGAEGLCLDDVALDLRVPLEVLVDEALRLLAWHLHPPGEPEIAHPVDDPEVEHLRDVSPLLGDLVLVHVEAGCRGPAVNVGALAKGGGQSGIAGHVREDAQLDLRVVRGEEDEVGATRNERAPDAATEWRADRDVLKVRVLAREPAGRGDRL